MVVEAGRSEHTLSVSFGHDICLSVLALSTDDHSLLIHIYLSHFENQKRRLRKQAR